MIKVNKMFWVESILEAEGMYKKLMKEGKVNQQYFANSLKGMPFYCSKELTVKCFMRKTKIELNEIYNTIRELIYKFE